MMGPIDKQAILSKRVDSLHGPAEEARLDALAGQRLNILFPQFVKALAEHGVDLYFQEIHDDGTTEVLIYVDDVQQARVLVNAGTGLATLHTSVPAIGSPTFRDFPTAVSMILAYRVAGTL